MRIKRHSPANTCEVMIMAQMITLNNFFTHSPNREVSATNISRHAPHPIITVQARHSGEKISPKLM